jgi:hypothetical protein
MDAEKKPGECRAFSLVRALPDNGLKAAIGTECSSESPW